METMERKKPRPRRSFTPEFKAEIVELCQRGERSIGQVARDFDLTETNVRTWVKQAEIDQGCRRVRPVLNWGKPTSALRSSVLQACTYDDGGRGISYGEVNSPTVRGHLCRPGLKTRAPLPYFFRGKVAKVMDAPYE